MPTSRVFLQVEIVQQLERRGAAATAAMAMGAVGVQIGPGTIVHAFLWIVRVGQPRRRGRQRLLEEAEVVERRSWSATTGP